MPSTASASTPLSTPATSTLGSISMQPSSALPPSPTPIHGVFYGVPYSTLIATCTALLCYVVSIAILASTKCPFNRNVVYFFMFLNLAVISLSLMAGLNMMYTKWRFNCISLTTSMLYSGSIALVCFGLVHSTFEGLCGPDGARKGGIFVSGVITNYIVWFITLIGLLFQICGHYYYG